MKKCPYEILGISRNASEQDIKKAYRIQAIRYHPDKNPDNKDAEEQIKKINEAYGILSDPEKKSLYDKFGWNAISENNNSNNTGGMDPFFNMFFNMNNNNPNKEQKPEVIFEKISITFEELYCGFTKTISFNKNVICNRCEGTGSKSKKNITCSGCNGSGIKVEIRQFGPMIQQFQSTCNICNGSGESCDISDKCLECNGQRTTLKLISETLIVSGSLPSDFKLSLPNRGHENPKGVNGDLVIDIEVIENNNWKRESNESLNIIHKIKVSLQEHYYSNYLYINNLDGRVLRLSKKNIHPKITTFVIPSYGLHNTNNLNEVGNLIVLIDIIMPEILNNINDVKIGMYDKNVITTDIDTIIDASTVCNKYFKMLNSKVKQNENRNKHNDKPECVQQ